MIPEFPFAESSKFPVRAGNRLNILVDGGPAFRRILQAAKHAKLSVWLTIPYLWPDLVLSENLGLWDVLDELGERGRDVRLICWRPHPSDIVEKEILFPGTEAQRDMLSSRHPHLKVRWDRAAPGYRQHQKMWLIDADTPKPIAFVGGINLNNHSMVEPGHRRPGQNHDVYLEISGPCAGDVATDFSERWNFASERDADDGACPPANDDIEMDPARIDDQGSSVAQVQRTTSLQQDRLAASPRPSTRSHGETSIHEQYLRAVNAARRTIYIENQYFEEEAILEALGDALCRGVQVIAVVPKKEPHSQATCQAVAAIRSLTIHRHFLLAGLEGKDRTGAPYDVYVHSKIMIIDDVWATIGSANITKRSMFGNGELNVSFADSTVVRRLRSELYLEHTGVETNTLSDTLAMQLFRESARAISTNQDRSARSSRAVLMQPDMYYSDL